MLSAPLNLPRAVLEAAKNINKPYVAVVKNVDNALLEAKGFDTPEATQAWAKEAGGAPIYKVTGRDAGGAVKALEPVATPLPLQELPAGGARGDNRGDKLRWKPDGVIQGGKAAAENETKGFLDGLDEGMGGLIDVKDDVPEGIDFAAEGGKAGGGGEYITGTEAAGIEGTGAVGKYTKKIKWGIKDVEVRPAGEGFFGQRTQQNNTRVDAYELKINPNNESYYLKSPTGGYVQYENMVNNVVMDGKLILQQKSFYHVNDLPEFARYKVLQEAMRQVDAAKNVGYSVEWLISDPKAVAQLSDFFKSKNIDIVVTYFPE